MKELPEIKEYVISRPGAYNGAVSHFVPDVSKDMFWAQFYELLRSSCNLNLPFANADTLVNPYFGYFGLRYHPTLQKKDYFHVGVDFDGAPKTPVFPVLDGILEYSGFGTINGKYVMLSHPEIKTKDGFILYSLYMHLRDLKVSFTAYQKMLREVSFNTYPQIPISSKNEIGLLGQTGNAKGYPHLHLQLEFRNEAGDIVLIDPLLALGLTTQDNLTKDIGDPKAYKNFIKRNKEDLRKTNLKDFINEQLKNLN